MPSINRHTLWAEGEVDPTHRASLLAALAAGFVPDRLAFRLAIDRCSEAQALAWQGEASRLHLPVHLHHEGPLGREHAPKLIALWRASFPRRRRVQWPQFEALLRCVGADLGLCESPPPHREDAGAGVLGGGQGEAWVALAQEVGAALRQELAAHLDALAMGQSQPLGPLMASLKEHRHPAANARIAAQSVALHLLGSTSGDRPAAARRLVTEGGAPDEATALALLAGHETILRADQGRNNLYVHVTYRCQLSCPHCYSSSGGASTNAGHDEMTPEALWDLLVAAQAEGFRQAVITGGEPWFHRRRPELMAVLRRAKQELKPMRIALRSNLVATLSSADLQCLADSVDKLAVSVDGDEARHDQIRGPGSHRRTLNNLKAYQAGPGREPGAAELMLAAALPYRDIHGAQGAAVRALAAALGVKELRLNELKPLGRGSEGEGAVDLREGYPDHLPAEGLRQMKATKNCGLGTSLYVDPSGDAHPCNFFHGPKHRLGNVFDAGLTELLASHGFRSLVGQDVDSNRKCSSCGIRYLCGLSLCRVHGGAASLADPNAPVHCEGTPHRVGIERQVALAQRYLQAIAPTRP